MISSRFFQGFLQFEKPGIYCVHPIFEVNPDDRNEPHIGAYHCTVTGKLSGFSQKQNQIYKLISKCRKWQISIPAKYLIEAINCANMFYCAQYASLGKQHKNRLNLLVHRFSKRANCGNAFSADYSFLGGALLSVMHFLPGRNSNRNDNSHEATQRLNPAGCICREPPVLHPIGNGAHQQPQHCSRGYQQAQKNDCLLDQPFLLTTHPMQLQLPGNAISLPVAACLVHGGTA